MKPQVVPVDTTQKVVFTTFWRFGQKYEKFSLKNRKNSEKKTKKLFFPQFLLWAPTQKLENHAKCFCRKSITIQNFRKKKSSHKLFLWTRRSQFRQLFEVFWPKVWKIFRSKSEKILRRKIRKLFLPHFLLWTRK